MRGQLRSGGYLGILHSPGDGPSEALVDNSKLSRLEKVQLEWQELFQAVLDAEAQRQRSTRCEMRLFSLSPPFRILNEHEKDHESSYPARAVLQVNFACTTLYTTNSGTRARPAKSVF